MNTWKNMTLSSVTFGLVMASIVFFSLSSPITEAAPSWAKLFFNQEVAFVSFFWVLLSYANIERAAENAFVFFPWSLVLSLLFGGFLEYTLKDHLPGNLGILLGFILGMMPCITLGIIIDGTKLGDILGAGILLEESKHKEPQQMI